MEAEAQSIVGDSTLWAMGCVWASLKDRFARDWWFVPAVILLPIAVFMWKTTVFFSTSSWVIHQRIPGWMAVTSWIASPFPLVLLFAWWRQGILSRVAVAISFIAIESVPLWMFWQIGLSPAEWFGPNVNWYKCDPNIRIGVAGGITLDCLAWLAALWLGSRLRRLTSPTG
jgi:hypothetical protein